MKKQQKKDLSASVYARIKEGGFSVKMNGPWITLDALDVPSDLLIDMAICDPNELARLVKTQGKS